MRGVLRRVFWLGPTLILVTVVAFGFLASALPREAGTPPLPLFLNPDPEGAERFARRTLAELAEGSTHADAAARELARQGGAALPFVLPALDSLTPEGRGRVASALKPVRERMGFESDEAPESGQEVVFWSRFWEEHSIDFRRIVAEQAVRRLAQRPSVLRRAEVRRLDTYALGDVIAAMEPATSVADVERVRVLSELAADMTGEETLRLSPDASLAEARAVSGAWLDWWSTRRVQYTTYRGVERIVAMLRDTRYGSWVTSTARRELGALHGGESAWGALAAGTRITLPLLVLGLFGSWLSGVLFGAVAAACELRWTRLLHAAAAVSAALPTVVLAALFAPRAGPGPSWLGALLMLAAGVPLMSSYASVGETTRLAQAFVRSLRALGASRWQAAQSTLRLSSPTLIAQLGAQASRLITLVFVVEYALGLPGLGTRTIAAVKASDLDWLMTITIASTLFVGLLQIASDVAVNTLDPRLRAGAAAAGAFE